ncbi:MAG: AMP-binding protein [Gammaproteobacteria bacterium]|nr:AMP-binding protein [Gammaproteobacteria bacterium]
MRASVGSSAGVLRAAAAFLACGLRRAIKSPLWAPNCAEWVVAALGAQSAGAVIVPLNTRFRGKEAGYILRRSRARLLLTVGEFLGVHYTELLTHEALPDSNASSCCEAPARVTRAGGFLARRGRPEARVIAARDAIGPTTSPTCCSPSKPYGRPEGRHECSAPPCQTFSVWSDSSSGCAPATVT